MLFVKPISRVHIILNCLFACRIRTVLNNALTLTARTKVIGRQTLRLINAYSLLRMRVSFSVYGSLPIKSGIVYLKFPIRIFFVKCNKFCGIAFREALFKQILLIRLSLCLVIRFD